MINAQIINKITAEAINKSHLNGQYIHLYPLVGQSVRVVQTKAVKGERMYKTINGNWLTAGACDKLSGV